MARRGLLLAQTTLITLLTLSLLTTATSAKPKSLPKLDANVPPYQEADVPSPKTSASADAGFIKAHQKFNERVKQGNVDLLFIGDSITNGWSGNGKAEWAKHYEKRNAVNLGIGGDQTQHVLWRLQNGNLDGPIKPKAAVVMIGTNNVGRGFTPEQIASGIEQIVKTIQEKLPETKVLLLAVFPRGEDPAQSKVKEQREKITAINNIIQKLDNGKTVFYLDIGPKFLEKDSTLNNEIMYDYLHLTPKGYGIWAEAIEDRLAQLMGEK